MAAGLGFKDFVTGEVLTAADVDGYLMQGIWVFASAAARDAAVTSPQEGNFAYLKDTNVTTYYTGSAWANLDTTGMTNPMTTTGDTIYSSSGSTPARLGIGTAGQVLTVNSGATAPEWATPAGGSTFVGATVYNTDPARQTISNATLTALTFNTDELDTNAFHDTSTNTSRFTVPAGKAGVYRFYAKIANGVSTAGTRQLRMYKNGTYNTYLVATTVGESSEVYQGEYTINLAVADYLEIYAYQSSGGNLLIDTGRDVAQISFIYLGA